MSKHPASQPASSESICKGDVDPPVVRPVLFECIDAAMICKAALHTEGAAGPSCIDARGWRRICTSFQTASHDLCQSLALLARKLCTVVVDPEGLAPLMACRLIALDKNPVARRIIAKAVLYVTRGDIQDAAGSSQLCAGQTAGTEAAVHAMNHAYHSDEAEAVMLVDASEHFSHLCGCHLEDPQFGREVS